MRDISDRLREADEKFLLQMMWERRNDWRHYID
jgi:hypothetical protein